MSTQADESSNIFQTFEASALTVPGKIAVQDASTTRTYAQLYEDALNLAARLHGFGIRQGDLCVAMLANHVDNVLLSLALARIGAIEVPVNTAYRGSILRTLVEDSAPKLVIADTEYRHVIDSVLADSNLSVDPDVLIRPPRDGALSSTLASVFSPSSGSKPPGDMVSVAHATCVIYTSGTTGRSKGVLTSHAHALEFALGPRWVGPDDVVLVPLPLFHIGGKFAGVLASLAVGATAIIMERFSVQSFWQLVEDFNVTQTMLTGSMPHFLMSVEESDDDAYVSLQRAVIGPVSKTTEEFGRRFGVEIGTAYALTEGANPIVAPYGHSRPGVCGRIRDGFEVRLVDDFDHEVPRGQVGEVCIRAESPWVTMLGYWKRPAETVEAWQNLWLHTGDLLRLLETGEYEFIGRKHDVIRRRGENIAALEVEDEINQHPAVLESAVVAVPDEHAEDCVMAFIVTKDGHSMDFRELIEYLDGRLPYFMVPRFFSQLEDLPKTPTGRVQKAFLSRLVDRAWDGEAHGYFVTGRKGK